MSSWLGQVSIIDDLLFYFSWTLLLSVFVKVGLNLFGYIWAVLLLSFAWMSSCGTSLPRLSSLKGHEFRVKFLIGNSARVFLLEPNFTLFEVKIDRNQVSSSFYPKVFDDLASHEKGSPRLAGANDQMLIGCRRSSDPRTNFFPGSSPRRRRPRRRSGRRKSGNGRKRRRGENT